MLPHEYLKSVIWIGHPVNSPKTQDRMAQDGTGFLYHYSPPDSTPNRQLAFKTWLVTCKHVIVSDEPRRNDTVLLRMNMAGRYEMQVFELDLPKTGSIFRWYFHPTADVAATPIPENILKSSGVQWRPIGSRHGTLSREKAIEAGLSEGDEVYILGFPTGWAEGRRDYPVVRHGVVAQIEGWKNGDHNTFLVDGSGFPGGSGGPVVVKHQIASIGGRMPIAGSLLVGMVSASQTHFVQPSERHEDENVSAMIRVLGLTEAADLIEVIPVDTIEETIRIGIGWDGQDDE